MRHRVLAVIAGLSVVIAACGGGGSNNGRTEKVAAVATDGHNLIVRNRGMFRIFKLGPCVI